MTRDDDDLDPDSPPRRKRRLDSCPDGMCGGCYSCLRAQGRREDCDLDDDAPDRRVALAPWRLGYHSLMRSWLEARAGDARYTYAGRTIVPC